MLNVTNRTLGVVGVGLGLEPEKTDTGFLHLPCSGPDPSLNLSESPGRPRAKAIYRAIPKESSPENHYTVLRSLKVTVRSWGKGGASKLSPAVESMVGQGL